MSRRGYCLAMSIRVPSAQVATTLKALWLITFFLTLLWSAIDPATTSHLGPGGGTGGHRPGPSWLLPTVVSG